MCCLPPLASPPPSPDPPPPDPLLLLPCHGPQPSAPMFLVFSRLFLGANFVMISHASSHVTGHLFEPSWKGYTLGPPYFVPALELSRFSC